jgi:hypothetical protein
MRQGNKLRALILDLDGTALNAEKQVTARTAQAVAKLRNKGVVVTIATGRPPVLIYTHAQRLGINAPYICCNGAAIMPPDNRPGPLYQNSIACPEMHELLLYLLNEKIDFHLFSPNTFWYARMRPEVLEAVEFNPVVPEHWRVSINKLTPRFIGQAMSQSASMMLHEGNRPGFAQQLCREFNPDGRFVFIKTYNDYADVLDKRAQKGAALHRWSRITGIPLEKTAVIGDQDNDLELFRDVGYKIAMGNGSANLKQIADYITLSNNEDGVAHAIEDYLLALAN